MTTIPLLPYPDMQMAVEFISNGIILREIGAFNTTVYFKNISEVMDCIELKLGYLEEQEQKKGK